jgi:LCP family protein required for cell wall assembly
MSRRSRSGRPRRTWPQRLLIVFNVFCIVGALTAAGTLAYAKRKVGEIDRIVIGGDFQGSADLSSKDPRNFLLVGADSDDGLAADDPARAGRDATVGGVRSDTIMIVRIDPATTQAKILSFPRDLWVDIPGHSRSKINAALQFGGPDLLISTIKANFDIDVNHYVQVDFAAFKRLVKMVGGVPVYFATPVRDTQSGLNVENAGCTTLDENGALSYVRSRHFRYQNENGRWVSDPTSDLGRISRQQDFIKRVLRRAIAQGARNPAKLAGLLDVAVKNIALDDATTPGDLLQLGNAFRNFDPSTLQTFSLPVTDGWRGGAAVLDLRRSEAEPILAQFRSTGASSPQGELSPAAISVEVLNGSGKQDQAAQASQVLATAGFRMSPPNSSASVDRTEVRFPPGMEAQAVVVARHLGANPLLIADQDVSEITVVTGPDFVAALLDARPESEIEVPTTAATTSTTEAQTSTTSSDGSPSPTTVAPSTTSTTQVLGFVPDAAPAGVDCG